MVGGIGAPGTPGIGAALDAPGINGGYAMLLAGVAQTKIRRGEGVGVTQRTHGDV